MPTTDNPRMNPDDPAELKKVGECHTQVGGFLVRKGVHSDRAVTSPARCAGRDGTRHGLLRGGATLAVDPGCCGET